MFLRTTIFLLIIILTSSCSKEKIVYQPTQKVDPYLVYKEGIDAFEKNDYFYASKKFTEAELNFKRPKFAAKSAIMASFSLYAINFYEEANESLENFLKIIQQIKCNLCSLSNCFNYFEQIDDEKYDLSPLNNSQEKIDFFLEKYPNTDYAIDLRFKKNLLLNQFAAKELYVAKYYITVQKWIPAIKRLKNIIEKYDETVFIEEALHRLVEIHYHLGLVNEAKNYASILGYNYNSSEWFKQSYKILNKDYKISIKKEKRKKAY